jgi:hypothetical protein
MCVYVFLIYLSHIALCVFQLFFLLPLTFWCLFLFVSCTLYLSSSPSPQPFVCLSLPLSLPLFFFFSRCKCVVQVRVWGINKANQTMIASMKVHQGTVTYLEMSKTDKECLSASHDGSCITWDMERYALFFLSLPKSLYLETFHSCHLFSRIRSISCTVNFPMTHKSTISSADRPSSWNIFSSPRASTMPLGMLT